MKIQDLIIGANYFIVSVNGNGKPWEGIATFDGLDASGHYSDKSLRFTCEDGVGGVFDIGEVKCLSQHQGSVTEQMEELHRIATKLKLNDATDWLRDNFFKR